MFHPELDFDTLNALLTQERRYSTKDFLNHPEFQGKLDIDADCRTKMAAFVLSRCRLLPR